MKLTFFWVNIALLTSLAIVSGCTSYVPPKNIPNGKMAFIQEHEIETGSFFTKSYESLDVTSINRVSTHTFMQEMIPCANPFRKGFWVNQTVGKETFQVGPGPCLLSLTYSNGGGTAYGSTIFTAKPGQVYQIRHKRKREDKIFAATYILFYVIDKRTGKPVNPVPNKLTTQF